MRKIELISKSILGPSNTCGAMDT